MRLVGKHGAFMMKLKILAVLVCLTITVSLSLSSLRAQVTIDMSKVTCADYLAMPPDKSRTFSAWMSGYFNQKLGYAWVDLNVHLHEISQNQ